jgi:hypothetical protein
MSRVRTGLVALVFSLVLAGPAAALSMLPGSVVLDSVAGGSIEYTLAASNDAGDILVFDVATTPNVFDTITLAFDAVVIGGGEISDPDDALVANLPAIVDQQLLVDFFGPSTARFWVALSNAPTQLAFFQNLDFRRPAATASFSGDAQVPEPGAALVFGAGLLVVLSAFRRRAWRRASAPI